MEEKKEQVMKLLKLLNKYWFKDTQLERILGTSIMTLHNIRKNQKVKEKTLDTILEKWLDYIEVLEQKTVATYKKNAKK